ncbi:proline-rich protein HaeIII subfamily 1-like [Penaeus monodon]|uniref:proline-rich protein HaeIII subfamily 1-like n=1 Tax=Penaeus monodon TaxID=6687 RepID=UPI0018A7B862|nr:proline-rich protein HaeIII subfamily 1-like [Penaeus monodon]
MVNPTPGFHLAPHCPGALPPRLAALQCAKGPGGIRQRGPPKPNPQNLPPTTPSGVSTSHKCPALHQLGPFRSLLGSCYQNPTLGSKGTSSGAPSPSLRPRGKPPFLCVLGVKGPPNICSSGSGPKNTGALPGPCFPPPKRPHWPPLAAPMPRDTTQSLFGGRA